MGIESLARATLAVNAMSFAARHALAAARAVRPSRIAQSPRRTRARAAPRPL
jgi:hypothetical protein